MLRILPGLESLASTPCSCLKFLTRRRAILGLIEGRMLVRSGEGHGLIRARASWLSSPLAEREPLHAEVTSPRPYINRQETASSKGSMKKRLVGAVAIHLSGPSKQVPSTCGFLGGFLRDIGLVAAGHAGSGWSPPWAMKPMMTAWRRAHHKAFDASSVIRAT